MKKIAFLLLYLVSILGAASLGFWYAARSGEQSLLAAVSPATHSSIRQGSRDYINPLLDCDNEQEFESLQPFKHKLSATIDDYSDNYAFSVYFRDLENGYWFGINEKQSFIPASLVKLPTIIAAYKARENKDPNFFDETITYNGEFDSLRNLDSNFIEKDAQYSIYELVKQSAIYSDNEAHQVLKKIIDDRFPDLVTEVAKHFGTYDSDEKHTMKEYSSLFRVLYNASFLTEQDSYEVLNLLANADLQEGIPKYIPNEVVVAHKYGYYDSRVSDHIQFNQCAIVYFPYKPYLLCISAKGKSKSSVNTLTKITAELSKEIYDEVSSQVEFNTDE